MHKPHQLRFRAAGVLLSALLIGTYLLVVALLGPLLVQVPPKVGSTSVGDLLEQHQPEQALAEAQEAGVAPDEIDAERIQRQGHEAIELRQAVSRIHVMSGNEQRAHRYGSKCEQSSAVCAARWVPISGFFSRMEEWQSDAH